MKGNLVGGLIVLALIAGACGDDDSGPSEATLTAVGGGESGGADNQGGDGGTGPGTSGNASATVTVGADTYEFTTAAFCSPDPNGPGGLGIRFEDGGNWVSLTALPDLTLARMFLDGSEWADAGSADEPDVSGSNVTWSGPMGNLQTGEGSQDVEMTFSC